MCTKSRFSSRALALQRLHEIQTKEEARDRTPVRVYSCQECGGYHLTSTTLTKKEINKLLKGKAKNVRSIADDWRKRMGWDEEER